MENQQSSSTLAIFGGIIIAAVIIAGAIIYSGKTELKTTDGNNGAPIEDAIVNPNDPLALSVGSENAPLTMFVFEDYQCPFCKQYHDDALAQIRQKYVQTGKVRIIFRNKAFLGPESELTAMASWCANEQGEFEKYSDALFANQGRENSGAFLKPGLKEIAANLELNQDQFNECIDADKYKSAVANEKKGTDRVGVTSTPTTYIGGKFLKGVQSYESIKTIIEQELADNSNEQN